MNLSNRQPDAILGGYKNLLR